jgi:hypothetical protein
MGKVMIRKAAVTALMKKFPDIDPELSGEAFRDTHAVRLGRAGSNYATRESTLVIDGGPLACRCLDHVPQVGKMSLADSATGKKKKLVTHSPVRCLFLCAHYSY